MQTINTPIKKSLYSIRVDHLTLLQEIEDNDGELSPEIEQALQLTEQDFQEKAISFGYVLKSFDDITETIDREIDRLTALKQKSIKRYQLFKQKLDEGMKQFGVEKITTPTLTLSYRKSKAVEITDETLIPDLYKIQQEPRISKTLIKTALDEGMTVLGAHMIENKNLQIR